MTVPFADILDKARIHANSKIKLRTEDPVILGFGAAFSTGVVLLVFKIFAGLETDDLNDASTLTGLFVGFCVFLYFKNEERRWNKLYHEEFSRLMRENKENNTSCKEKPKEN